MPRLPRNFYDTSFFHVICQGIQKNYIFDYKEDIEKYINIMYELHDKHNINIIAYCVMNNHVHMLIETKSVHDMSSYMHQLNAKYAQYYNKKYKRVGFVFRNRFKSEAIFSELYLYSCINYIFNNPVKAKICNNPIKYPYSNYKEYISLNGQLPTKSKDLCETFIDIIENQENKANEIIQEFLTYKCRNIYQISNNPELLKELVLLLEKSNISLRTMEKSIGVNRKRLKSIILDDKIV